MAVSLLIFSLYLRYQKFEKFKDKIKFGPGIRFKEYEVIQDQLTIFKLVLKFIILNI